MNAFLVKLLAERSRPEPRKESVTVVVAADRASGAVRAAVDYRPAPWWAVDYRAERIQDLGPVETVERGTR